jgi:putative redox protein
VKVTATHHGGYAVTVEARGRTVEVDEPEPLGDDTGFMPTELLFAALASCFALSLGHAARKRDIELPGLRVEVTAARPGSELRYDDVVVTATADIPNEQLAELVRKAERFCWVSNTFASPPQIEYRAEEVP